MAIYKKLPPRIKNTASSFIKAAITVTLILLAFEWISNRYNVKEQLGKVSEETWIAIITVLGVPIFQWQKSKEKEEIKLAQDQAKIGIEKLDENQEFIKQVATKLETRINGVLMQVDGVRSDVQELTKNLQNTDQRNLELDEKIDQHRHQLLTERLDIVVKMYSELCNIHSTINYIKGQASSNNSMTDIETIAHDIQGKKSALENKPD